MIPATIRMLPIFWILFLAGCSQSQNGAIHETPKEKATALEAFMSKRGNIQIKDAYKLGIVKGTGYLKLDALVIYEPGGAQKIKGTRVEVSESGDRSNTSFLDIDELESLSQALSYISDLAAKWKGQMREPYTEVAYTSQGHLRIGFYQQGNQLSAFASSGNIERTTAFIEVADLPQVKFLIDRATTLLKEK